MAEQLSKHVSVAGGNDKRCEDDLNAKNSCSSISEIRSMSNENNVSLTAPSFNNNENFKNALLASLYSQVDFLRKELEEKNLIILTLIIKESQSNCGIKSNKSGSGDSSLESDTNYETRSIIRNISTANNDAFDKNSIMISSSFNISSYDTIDPRERGDDIEDELFFSQLYHEYERSRKDEMEKQLMEVRVQKPKLFLGVNVNETKRIQLTQLLQIHKYKLSL